MILHTGRPVTVHASTTSSFVTVADVLEAINVEMYGKVEMMFGVVRPPNLDNNGVEICHCQGVFTGLEYLRNRHGKAGLVRNEEGLDIWNLQLEFR